MPRVFNVKPTRMEYLRTVRRIAIARKGLKLLKLKRQALILEFFNLSKKIAALRSELREKIIKGYEAVHKAEMLAGVLRIEYEAQRIPKLRKAKIRTKNVMGVKLPELEVEETFKEASDFILELPPSITQVIMNFRDIHKSIIEVAEKETALRKLLIEIDKTKRRSNAIENILIPRLIATAKYIKLMFDEMERDNFVKLKFVKTKVLEK